MTKAEMFKNSKNFLCTAVPKQVSNRSLHDKFHFSTSQYFKNFFKTSQQQETKKPKKWEFFVSKFEKKELGDSEAANLGGRILDI